VHVVHTHPTPSRTPTTTRAQQQADEFRGMGGFGGGSGGSNPGSMAAGADGSASSMYPVRAISM
jgi:hypothetical protein